MPTVRGLIRQLLPPLLVPQPTLYETWAAAHASSHSTYESDLVNRFRIDRALLRRASGASFPVTSNLLYMTALLFGPEPLHIIDFGGATGELGESVVALLPNVRYTIVENKALTEMVRERLPDIQAKFTTEIPEQCDIFFTSGTLQYLSNPNATIETAFQIASKAVVLVRNSFCPRELFRVQRSKLFHNGSGPIPPGYTDCTIAYPHRTINEDMAHSLAERYGFACIAKAPEVDGVLPYKDWVYGRQLVFVREPFQASRLHLS